MNYHEDVLRCWCYWEALRRCGFAADDIYVSVYTDREYGFPVCGVELHTQGKKFVIRAARLERDERSFLRDWKQFGNDILAKLASNIKAREDAWKTRPADISMLPAGLVFKGFVLPGKN